MVKTKLFENINFPFWRDYKKFILSIIALLEVVILICAGTFAWIEGSKNANANGNNCSVSAGAGLQFMGYDSELKDNTITFKSDVTLQDCSSIDGRNFFFPTTGSIRKSTDTSSDTANIAFRKGIEEDANTKYLTTDFIIKSLEEPGSGTTEIFIDSLSRFTCTDGSAKPFRVSINFNDGTAPVLICPSITKQGSTVANAAVASIDANGKASTGVAEAYPMSKYYYGQTPVYSLKNGESRRVTVSVWLEGTDTDCTLSGVSNKNIDMSLILSTEDSNMKQITFVDYTPSSWIGNDGATISVVDKENPSATYSMKQSGNTYTASIPNNITDVYFDRVTLTTGEGVHNIWANTEGVTMGSSLTYYAIGQGYSRDGANYGYWVNDTKTKMLDIYFTDVGNALSIEKTDTVDGHAPFLYFYGTDYDTTAKKAWGGYEMAHLGSNDKGQQVYHMIIPADDAASIVFNNNLNDENICGCGKQHNGITKKMTGDGSGGDIRLKDYIEDSDPQIKRVGFYTTVDSNNNITSCDYWDPKDWTPTT